MSARSTAAPLWLAAALVPMIASQLVRLHQTDPAAWCFYDYAGRIGALAVLLAIPSARAVAFQRQQMPASQWGAALTIVVGLALAFLFFEKWLRPTINAAIPGTALGVYPVLHGWLYVFDLVVGLALAAYHEEIVFRRVARQVFQRWLGDGYAMVIATSLLFAAYHWWSGIGNICSAFLVGVGLMLAYRRLGALWPVVLAHYLMDITAFI
jgi:membrane protease YdiL (CAAX protease family)